MNFVDGKTKKSKKGDLHPFRGSNNASKRK